jgi:N-alpha-acetyltransferase 38, NatC auxiliary subunit
VCLNAVVALFLTTVIVRNTLMRDTEAIRNLKSILRGTLRIITHDDRAFIGAFVGTDKSLNILLVNTEEFRIGGPPDERPSAGRYVGQVMIPWRLVRSVGLQVAGESTGNAGGYGAEQVRCVPLRS